MSDLDDATLSPIPVHKNAWNQKDMLEGIVQRYVTIRSHTGGLWPTWEIESDQLEQKFDELNAYLKHLGWMARLAKDAPHNQTAIGHHRARILFRRTLQFCNDARRRGDRCVEFNSRLHHSKLRGGSPRKHYRDPTRGR